MNCFQYYWYFFFVFKELFYRDNHKFSLLMLDCFWDWNCKGKSLSSPKGFTLLVLDFFPLVHVNHKHWGRGFLFHTFMTSGFWGSHQGAAKWNAHQKKKEKTLFQIKYPFLKKKSTYKGLALFLYCISTIQTEYNKILFKICLLHAEILTHLIFQQRAGFESASPVLES